MTTTDLKALYDFSVLHANILENTGNINYDTRRAKKCRDLLYKELQHRMEEAAMEIEDEMKKVEL